MSFSSFKFLNKFFTNFGGFMNYTYNKKVYEPSQDCKTEINCNFCFCNTQKLNTLLVQLGKLGQGTVSVSTFLYALLFLIQYCTIFFVQINWAQCLRNTCFKSSHEFFLHFGMGGDLFQKYKKKAFLYTNRQRTIC